MNYTILKLVFVILALFEIYDKIREKILPETFVIWHYDFKPASVYLYLVVFNECLRCMIHLDKGKTQTRKR